MEEEIKLLEFLKSKKFILYVAMFTVIFLSPNTYYVFYSFCVFKPIYKEVASAGVAIIIAASIMIYTLRKNDRMASYYAWFEVSISAYYYISTIGWDWGLIPALSFAIIMPISVKNYAKELNILPEKRSVLDQKTPEKSFQISDYETRLRQFLNENPSKKPSDFKFS